MLGEISMRAAYNKLVLDLDRAIIETQLYRASGVAKGVNNALKLINNEECVVENKIE